RPSLRERVEGVMEHIPSARKGKGIAKRQFDANFIAGSTRGEAMLGAAEQAMLAAMIFVIMLGMGATIHRTDIVAAFRRRRAFLIGMFCQFGLMPLIAFLLALALALPPPAALALIMLGATPGGTTSNLFSYWAKGDVTLSIAMTVASTLAAIVLMPLAIALYATEALTGDVEIPLASIAVTLVLVSLPAFLGYLVRARNVVAAAWIEWIGSVAGMVLIAALILNFFRENSAMIFAVPFGELLAALLLSLCGFAAGFALSRLLGLDLTASKTVSLETGIQNAPLTITVIGLSFAAGAAQDQMLLMAALYAVFVVITSTLTSWYYASLKPAV
ncbi:MAG: bile acid:sodium symporter, partial [Tabrizicola sp.]|nr:bile acid:sodium symporter [Tabrizicola sp.]